MRRHGRWSQVRLSMADRKGDMVLDVNEYVVALALLALIGIGCIIGFMACRRLWKR
jgi:hypothetical protein